MSYVNLQRLRGMAGILALLCVGIGFICIFSANAYAVDCIDFDSGQRTGVTSSSVGQNNGITTTLVGCVNQAMRNDAYLLLGTMSDFLTNVVGALSIFAIAWHAIKIFGGEGEIKAQTIGFLIKLAAINVFFYNLSVFKTLPFDLMDELANAIGPTPWSTIDGLLGQVFGFDSTNQGGRLLYHGTVGMASAAAFAGAPGFIMFAAALFALFEFVMLGMEIVYVYLVSVLVLALMVIMSPLMIPLLIFRYSEKYYMSWLKTMMGAVLIPVFLFGFLSFSMNFFTFGIPNTTGTGTKNIGGIPDILSGLNPQGYTDPHYAGLDYFTPYTRQGHSLFNWTMSTDPNAQQAATQSIINANPNEPPTLMPTASPNISSRGAESPMVKAFSLWSINFGAANHTNFRDVALSFAALWIYASVMMELVSKMPEVAQEVAGMSISISFQGQSLKQKVSENLQNLKFGGGALLGGLAGKEVGKSITKSAKGREASALAGIIGGGLVSGRL